MAHLDKFDLGLLIFRENPYTKNYVPPAAIPAVADPNGMSPDDQQVEKQLDLGQWYFKGVPHNIERALRIAYTYRDVDTGAVIRDYLLIGYEGGGAY